MKNDRLFEIVYLLLEKKNMTAPELAEHFEVSVRTIYRDIDSLCASGIPVMTSQGKNGGISLMPGYSFDRSLLSDREQDEILFALQTMKLTTPLGEAENKLLGKLGAIFKKEERSWIEVDFSRWGDGTRDRSTFELMKRCILDHVCMKITYAGRVGADHIRVIHPYRLIFKSASWYLQGFCEREQGYRTFKVNRIVTAEALERNFEDNTKDLPELDFGDSLNHDVMEIELHVSAEQAFRVYDEYLPEHIEQLEDGSVIVRDYATKDKWFLDYLLTLGEAVEIRKPQSLKKELYQYSRQITEYLEHQKDL